MAKYKVLDAAGTREYPVTTFDTDAMVRDSATKHELVYHTPSNGYKIVLHGNFSFAFGGEFKGGTIDHVTFKRVDDVADITVSGVSLNAKQADTQIMGAHTFDDFFVKLLSHNDTLTGTAAKSDMLNGFGGSDRINGLAGDDRITGGKGNDRLTGGEGFDSFYFLESKFGKDVITDFDAVGGAGNQDFIHADPDDVKSVTKSHSDTLVNFYDGSQILLLHVNHKDITTDDFVSNEWI